MTDADNIRRDFYVYLYRRDQIPVYVGKGSGKRWIRHASHTGHNPILHRMILKDQREGTERVSREKIADGLSETEALALEVATIASLGRRPAGPLVNLTDGGEGMVNPSPEVRAKLSAAAKAAMTGRVKPQEMREKIRATLQGRTRCPEATAKATAANKGRARTPEQRAKFSLAQMGNKNNVGRIFSEEERAKIRAAQLGRKMLPEQVAKCAAANTGKKRTEEQRAAMSAARKGKPKSAEHAAKVGAAHRGRPKSEEQKEKQRQAMTGRTLSPEHAAKIGAIHKGRVWSQAQRDAHRQAIHDYHRRRREALTATG